MSDKTHYDLDLLLDNPHLCAFLLQCKFKDARKEDEVFLDTPYPAPYFLQFDKFMKIIKNPDNSPKGGAVVFGINAKELGELLAHAVSLIPDQIEQAQDSFMGDKIDPVKQELNIKNVGIVKVHNGKCIEIMWKHFFLTKVSLSGDKLGSVVTEVKEQVKLLNSVYEKIEEYPEIKMRVNAKHARHDFSIDLTLGDLDTFSWRKNFYKDIDYMIEVYDQVVEAKKTLLSRYSQFKGDITLHNGPENYFISIKAGNREFSLTSQISKIDSDIAKCKRFFNTKKVAYVA
jgi:hypothetical protein